MRGLVLLVPIALLSPALAQEDENRIRELEQKIAALERENEGLKKTIAWLEMLRDRPDGATKRTAVIRLGGEPDRGHLEGITLPEAATKDEVREYIARILRAAASHRNTYGADDPEVELLRRVGPAHVDVLVEPLVYVPILNGSNYLVEALKTLSGEEHKELVLKSLPSAWELIEVVLAREWTEAAAPTLLRVLADRDAWSRQTLPTEWIEAVAALRRPECHEHLRNYFYYGDNRYHTWQAIRDLPGLELTSEVDRLWPWAKKLNNKWVRLNMAAVAAHYGHLDALEVLFEEPDQWPRWEVIESVTPYRGRRDEVDQAKEWFKTHRDRLVFDAAEGKYRVAEDAPTGDKR